jgi:hypothetical protein
VTARDWATSYPSPAGGGWPPSAAGWGEPSVKTASIVFKHTVEISINIAIPESKNAETLGRELRISANVANVMPIEIMLAAIDLDDEQTFHTDKIDDVTFAWRLASEMKSALAP